MNARLCTLGAALAMAGLSSAAQATLVEVSQGGTSLGVISSYSDASGHTSAQNYNYSSSKNHLITGPASTNSEGHIFFYEGSDGLSFNVIFGSVGTGSSRKVYWDLALTGNVGNANVLVTDDGGELTEPTANNFSGRWNYQESYGDGGVIGVLSGSAWSLTITPGTYQYVNALEAYDSSGSYIDLAVNTTQDIVFSVVESVPEPASLGLFVAGLLGLGFGRRRKR